MQEQWRAYIAAMRRDTGADLEVHVLVEENDIKIVVDAVSASRARRVKRVITQLNEAMPGLGWYVYEAIGAAREHAYPLMTVSDMSSMAECMWHMDSTTDEELHQALVENYGEEGSLEEIRDEGRYGFPWPSDFDNAVDGHKWMLGRYGHTVTAEKPKRVTRAAARAFARDPATDPHLRGVVKAALALLRDARRKDHPLGKAHRDFCDSIRDGDYSTAIGAAAFVVWDDPYPFLEAVEHWEHSAMEGGEETTTHLVIRASIHDNAAIKQAVQQLKAFVKRHALVSALLSHFDEVTHA